MNTLSHQIYYILAGAWRRRYAVVIPILLLPFVGLAVAIMAPKYYLSHTSMLIQETAKMNPFLKDLAVSAMLKERMAALQTLLHSRHILGEVALKRGMIDENSTPEYRDWVIAELSGALSVSMAGKDLIQIQYKSHTPDGMKETLEEISRQFVAQLLAPELSSMQDSSHFLAEHLKYRRQELDKAEAALAQFKDDNATELPELHSANITRLASLKQRLAEREAEMAGAQKSLGGLDQQLSRTNPVVGKIEEQIVRLRGELALLRTRYTDSHSKVQGALRNLKRLEQERQAILAQTEQTIDSKQLWDMASSTPLSNENGSQTLLISQLENLQLARSKVDGLTEEIRSLKNMITELEEQTAGYGAHQRDLNRLERDLKVKRDLYNELLNRYEMARLTGSLGIFEQEKRVKVIDRPYTPTAPASLPPVVFVIAGLFGGIFLGAGLALVLEVTDTTLRRRDRLEAIAGVPVICRIPPLATLNVGGTGKE